MKTRLGLVTTTDAATTDALFNLTIRYGNTSEKFLNVTVTDNARRIDRVLKAESSLVELTWPSATPTATKTKEAIVAFKDLLAHPSSQSILF